MFTCKYLYLFLSQARYKKNQRFPKSYIIQYSDPTYREKKEEKIQGVTKRTFQLDRQSQSFLAKFLKFLL